MRRGVASTSGRGGFRPGSTLALRIRARLAGETDYRSVGHAAILAIVDEASLNAAQRAVSPTATPPPAAHPPPPTFPPQPATAAALPADTHHQPPPTDAEPPAHRRRNRRTAPLPIPVDITRQQRNLPCTPT